MKKSEHLWKSMEAGLRSGYNGERWEIGKWKKIEGKPKLCENGYHASENIIDAMQYTNLENLAQVEVRGKCDKGDDKQAWTEMRVVQAWKWTKEDSVALAVYAAELAIDIFEKKYPDDDRPRKAIKAAKEWLRNPTEKNRGAASAAAEAARAATWDAARAAAWDAARAAAWAAARAAGDAWAVARAAARDATRDATRDAAWAAARAASAAWAAARAAAWDAASAAAGAASAATRDAAWAAGDAEGIGEKCHRWVLDRVESLEEATDEKE